MTAGADPPASFDPAGADPDPLARFARWWEEARASSPFADAVALATAGPDGAPSVRMVLLRGFERSGFVFFTNYGSAKARDLDANPRAALAFHWPELHRQVRATGAVERLETEESERYWASRPPGHRRSAWASPQSRVLADRADLERRMAEIEARYGEGDVPLPPFWGGYRVVPGAVEFWQGRDDRLHDRVRYSRDGDRWRIERLAP